MCKGPSLRMNFLTALKHARPLAQRHGPYPIWQNEGPIRRRLDLCPAPCPNLGRAPCPVSCRAPCPNLGPCPFAQPMAQTMAHTLAHTLAPAASLLPAPHRPLPLYPPPSSATAPDESRRTVPRTSIQLTGSRAGRPPGLENGSGIHWSQKHSETLQKSPQEISKTKKKC